MKPKVSVIIPSYNHKKFINKALDSVVNQSYENIQIVVVDDGSVDESSDLIEDYKQKCNRELIFVKQNNQGAHAAINRGLQLSNGDYLAILNSDDEFELDRIQSCIDRSLECNDESIIVSYINVVDQFGKSLGIKRAYQNMHPWRVENIEKTFLNTFNSKLNLLQSNYISTTSNLFFSRFVYEKIGNFRPLRYAHDWDYFLRISNYFNILILEKPLLKYRLHQTNTINENQARMVFEICWTLAENVPSVIRSTLQYLANQDDILDLWNRLFHSTEVLKCEKILINLLFFKYALQIKDSDGCQLHSNELSFVEFLNPENKIHQSSILEIQEILNSRQQYKPTIINRLKAKWKSLKYQ